MNLDLEIVDGRVRQKDRRSALERAFDFLLWHDYERRDEPLAVGWPLADEYHFHFEDVSQDRPTSMTMWAYGDGQEHNVIGILNRGEACSVVRAKDLSTLGMVRIFALHIRQQGGIPYQGYLSKVLADDIPVTVNSIHLSSFQPSFSWVTRWREAAAETFDEDDYCG